MEVAKEQQQIRVSERFPLPAYSRSENVEVIVPAGLGNDSVKSTGPLGNRLWLLGLTVHLFGDSAAADLACFWNIVWYGGPTPPPAGFIAVSPDALIRQHGIKPYFYYVGPPVRMVFPMRRLFTGTALGFAVWVQNGSAIVPIRANVTFEISEG